MKDKTLSFKLVKGSFQEPFLEKMMLQEFEDWDASFINKADNILSFIFLKYIIFLYYTDIKQLIAASNKE